MGLKELGRKKNFFFIIGAPKCGTTALYEYLNSHPNVYMPNIKEPHYYADDYPDMKTVLSSAAYLKLFEHAKTSHFSLGEASAWYYASDVAIKNILKDFPTAKFIFLVRNPIEMMISLHSQLVYTFKEDQKDFFRAWKLQAERAEGRALPKNVTSGVHLQYSKIASFGKHLEKLYRLVDKTQVKVVFHEDIIRKPRETYLSVLEFLQLPDDGRNTFERINEARSHRYPALAHFLIKPPFPFNVAKRIIRRFFFPNSSSWLRPMYMRLATPGQKGHLGVENKKCVFQDIENDVLLLSELTQKDLSHWRL